MRRRNNSQCQSRYQVAPSRKHSADLLSRAGTPALIPLRPDEVDEEGSAENERREDSGEDVVGRDTDAVFDVDTSGAIECPDTSCHVEIVCGRPMSAALAFELPPSGRVPDNAAALNHADATQSTTAQR